MNQKNKQISNTDRARIQKVILELRDRPPKTKEELGLYLIKYYDVYLAKKPIDPENSSPLDFVWDVYSTAMGFNNETCYNFLGMAARGSQKSLSCAVLECLLLTHDKHRDWFHMASIKEQSYVTYQYFKQFLSRKIMAGVASEPTMRETISRHGKQLKIGTATMDSVNSFHGCFSGTERIFVPSGFLKLDDVFKANRKPEYIESDNQMREVVAWKDSGKQQCWRLTMESGREILATPNHQILNFKDVFQFNRLDELNVGDTLISRHTGEWVGTRIPKNRFSKLLPINGELEDYYYLIGRAIGDGCLSQKDRIDYTTKSKIDANYIASIFKSVYPNSNPRVTEKTDKNCCSVCIDNKQIKKEWVDIGINPVTAKFKTVPEFVFYSSKAFFYEFLSGYWDSDGTARIRDGEFGLGAEISFCSISKELLASIQLLLSRDGIYSKLRYVKREENENTEYYLEMYGSDAIKIANRMKSRLTGFQSNKFDRISQIASLHGEHISDCILWDGDKILKLFKPIMTRRHSMVKSGLIAAHDKSYSLHSSDSFTNKKIQRLLTETIHCADMEEWRFLQKLITDPIWPDKIVKIEKDVGEFNTYDVQVKDVPIWAPSGFLVHNSVVQDELDLTPAKIFNESKGMLSAQHGKMPLNIAISSRKFAVGNIQTLLDKSKKDKNFPLKIHKWGILEITEKCLPERHGASQKGMVNTESGAKEVNIVDMVSSPKEYYEKTGEPEVEIYVNEQDLLAVPPEEYELMAPIERSKYERKIGYKNCLKCGIFSFCQGRLPTQDSGNPHLQPINLTRDFFKTDSLDFFKSQRLNKKPSTEGLIYGSWDEEIHVKTYGEMWEIFHGEPHPDLVKNPATGRSKRGDISLDELCSAFIKAGCRLVVGVDFGFSILAVCGLFFIDGSGRVYYVDELSYVAHSDAEVAAEIKRNWGHLPVDEVIADPESPGGQKEIQKATDWGIRKKVDKNVKEGIESMRRILRIPGTKNTRFYVSVNCTTFREEVRYYKNRIDAKTQEILQEVDKVNDHALDMARYVIHTIFGGLQFDGNFNPKESVEMRQFNPDSPLRAPNASELAGVLGVQFVDNREDFYFDPETKTYKPIEDKDDDPKTGGGSNFSFSF